MNQNEKTKSTTHGIVKVKLDVIFKKLFSENINLLHELLAGLLKLPKESIKMT